MEARTKISYNAGMASIDLAKSLNERTAKACAQEGLACDIQARRGMFVRKYDITITGTADRIVRLMPDLLNEIEEIERWNDTTEQQPL